MTVWLSAPTLGQSGRLQHYLLVVKINTSFFVNALTSPLNESDLANSLSSR